MVKNTFPEIVFLKKEIQKIKKISNKLPFWIKTSLIFLISCILFLILIPTKEILCPVQSSYSVDVPYEVSVPYEADYSYSITSNECTTGLKTLFDIWAFNRIFVVNNENKGGEFSITSIIQTYQRGEIRQTQTQYIQPLSYGEFNFEADVDYDEKVSCSVLVNPPQKTLYRTETQYKPETRYRQENIKKETNWLFGKC